MFSQISTDYFTDLLYPGNLFSWLLSPLPSGSRQFLFFIILTAAFSFLLIYGWHLVNSFARKGKKERRAVMSILVLIILAATTQVITASPVLDGYLNLPAGQAGRSLLPNVLVLLLLLLVGIDQRQKLKNFYQSSAYGKLVLFAAIWTVLPLLVFLPTLTFSHNSMYFSLIPFSVIVAVFLVDGLKNVKAMANKGKISLSAFGLSGALKTVSLLLVLVLALSFPFSTFLIKRAGSGKRPAALQNFC